MSGYLARLTARAGGAPAAAGPRLPSRFEPGAFGAPADVAVAAAAPDASHQTHAGGNERRPAARADVRAAELVVASPPAAGRDPAAPAPVPTAGVAAPQVLTTSRADPRVGAEPAESALPRAPGAASRPAPLRVQSVPPPAAQARAPAQRDEASTPAPDVVHVTIGRVEVRATVAAPSTTPRAPRPSRDVERSLHDYLAGRTR